MHEPANVSGKLLRLGAGQQHAVVQCMEKSLLGNPSLLLDEDAMHDGDLSRRSTKAQERNSNPGARRLFQCRIRHALGWVVPRYCRHSLIHSWPRLVCRPVMRFVGGVAAPTIERVVEQHSGFELFEIVRVHAGEAQRCRKQSRSFRRKLRPRSVGTSNHSGKAKQRWSSQSELVDHGVECAGVAPMAPKDILDVKWRASETLGHFHDIRLAARTETRRWIDEATNKPWTRDPVYLRASAGHPHSSTFEDQWEGAWTREPMEALPASML